MKTLVQKSFTAWVGPAVLAGATLLASPMVCLTARAATAVQTDLPATPPNTAPLGFTDTSKIIAVDFVLKLADRLGAEKFAREAVQTGSLSYHQFLTPEQFAERFGATQADYDAVGAWASASGLTLLESSRGRTLVWAQGTVAQLSKLLGVHFRDYQDTTGRVYSRADAGATVPDEIAGRITGIVGLNGFADKVPLVRMLPPEAHRLIAADGSGANGAYNAADLRTAYVIPPQPGLARTQTIAIFEQGGYDKTDVTKFLSANHLPSVPNKVRLVNGTGNIITSPRVELEAVLDIDAVIAMNPALKSVLVYEDGIDPFGTALLAALTAMANDNRAATISISYGAPESEQGSAQIAAENTLLTQLATQGVQVFVSAGDAGAYASTTSNPLGVDDPGSQPHVTGVGGTSLITKNNQGVYAEEVVWNTLPTLFSATGGGVSSTWPIPDYQMLTGSSIATTNGGSATMRNVPDVAAVADPFTGFAVYSQLNGGWQTVGGTSLAAPLWAGWASLIASATESLGLGRPGEFNPRFYQYEATEAPVGNSDLNDIISGNNGDTEFFGVPGYNAGVGYDNTTGLGSMFGTALALDIIQPTGSNPPAVPRNLSIRTTTTSVTFTWTPTTGATGYMASVYTVVDGGISHLLEFETVGATNTLTISGLTPGASYATVFYAVSPAGTSSEGFFAFDTKQ